MLFLQHQFFITFPKPQLDHPYQQPPLTQTATPSALDRPGGEMRSPWERSRSKTSRQSLALVLSEPCSGSGPEEAGERRAGSCSPLGSLLAGAVAPWAPVAALRQPPPVLAVGFGAGSHEHADHCLLGTIHGYSEAAD